MDHVLAYGGQSMRIVSLIYGSESLEGRRRTALWIVLGWALLVGWLLLRHAFWRDEVRALSLALQGDTVVDMLRAVHGEGHPAVWYLLLRGVHTLLPTPAVLPLVSVAVALAAALLLAWRSPFGWFVVAALLLGRVGLYEYSVMARNYGISMLLMFLFAALYPQHRDRGIALGLVLLVLANCNVHSAILAGAFALFWLLDILLDKSANRSPALRNFAINAVIAMVGVLLCAITIYPPFNDAARSFIPAGDSVRRLATALFLPASSFWELAGNGLPPAARLMSRWPSHYLFVSQLLMSVVLAGSAFGLSRRPAAMLAAWVALFSFSIFFAVVYPGFYRHQGLWLVFLVCMYWIVGREEPAGAAPAMQKLRGVGMAFFVVLLLLQIAVGVQKVLPIASGSEPESRSRELARLIEQTPELRAATILSDPDYLVEPLAYYLPNRTYLLREQRFGNVVHFTRNARLALYLQDILDDARGVRSMTQQPVVILLHERLDPSGPVRAIHEGYNWQLWTSPEQVRAFMSATRRIARFDPVCCNDESYDVYVLE
ncbi:MAG: hypothetical protein NTU56_02255 [Proteobacteria bacterium]|nr:hypothetical protein [Pseudomonadota bacterium]